MRDFVLLGAKRVRKQEVHMIRLVTLEMPGLIMGADLFQSLRFDLADALASYTPL